MQNRGESTVPSTLAEELRCNPYMRTTEPEVLERAGLPAGTAASVVLEAIRALKDTGAHLERT